MTAQILTLPFTIETDSTSSATVLIQRIYEPTYRDFLLNAMMLQCVMVGLLTWNYFNAITEKIYDKR